MHVLTLICLNLKVKLLVQALCYFSVSGVSIYASEKVEYCMCILCVSLSLSFIMLAYYVRNALKQHLSAERVN